MLARGRGKAQAGRDAAQPLVIDLTVSFCFGEAPEDRVTVIGQRRVPLVGSVFDLRDATLRRFVRLLLKAGLAQPRVLAEIVPALKLIKPKSSARR